MAKEVDNPKYDYLKSLLGRVNEARGRLGRRMDKPRAGLDSGAIWTSTAATAWKGQLHEQAAAYTRALASMEETVSDELSRTPRKCSEEEAERFLSAMDGYNRGNRLDAATPR